NASRPRLAATTVPTGASFSGSARRRLHLPTRRPASTARKVSTIVVPKRTQRGRKSSGSWLDMGASGSHQRGPAEQDLPEPGGSTGGTARRAKQIITGG